MLCYNIFLSGHTRIKQSVRKQGDCNHESLCYNHFYSDQCRADRDKLLAAIFLVLAILLNMMPDKNTTAATTTAQTEAAVSSTESETAAVASTEAEAGTEKSGTEAETAVQKETLLANTEQGTEAK